MRADSEDLLEYYKRELTYLRRMGIAFAEQYPKVAGRLELGLDQCPDPHIERLIEAFAFLTARIQYNLESEFPQFLEFQNGHVPGVRLCGREIPRFCRQSLRLSGPDAIRPTEVGQP